MKVIPIELFVYYVVQKGLDAKYDILFNNSATEHNIVIEMQDVIIRMFSWSVYVLKTFIEKRRYFTAKYKIIL